MNCEATKMDPMLDPCDGEASVRIGDHKICKGCADALGVIIEVASSTPRRKSPAASMINEMRRTVFGEVVEGGGGE